MRGRGRGSARTQSAAGTQRAGRFSRKDAMPSCPSSPAKKRAESSSSGSKSSGGVPARSSRFVSARAVGAPAVSSTSWARSSVFTSASGTTRSTNPPAAAVAASKTFPVSMSRCATCGTIRGSTTAEITAGTSPRRTSEKANVADSAATTTSQAARRPMPPARAGPRTTATAGFGEAQIACSSSGNSRIPCSSAPPPAASSRSIPEQNTRPAWSSTTTRTAGSAKASFSADRSWARIARERALRLAGESRVSVATPLETCTDSTWSSLTGRILPGRGGHAAHWEQMSTVLPLLETPVRPFTLPASAREGLATTPFGLYVHVPFCVTRCGYCDFNTYTSDELGPGANRAEYAGTAIEELRRAAETLGPDLPTVSTVFVGGGTPTLLPADDLAAVLSAVRDLFPVARGVEVTTEANPESVTPASLTTLREAGFTRISLGMQSAAEHVLAVLDRRHTPGRAAEAAREAAAAGFEHVNLDLIYGTPGESDADWAASLDAVLAAPVDHVSAYALIVEDGTRLARRISRGELPMPDDDVLADRYEQADATLRAVGFDWYEVSNWARGNAARCRHNELYWANANWWGIGPGAHSHVGGLRWWNVKHPAAYAGRLRRRESPVQDTELLDDDDRALEPVMLGLRLRGGLPLTALSEVGRARAADAVVRGLLEAAAHAAGRAVLTDRGRLL